MSNGWIEDTWTDKAGEPSATHGAGSRWKAYWFEKGFEHGRRVLTRRSKRFRTKAAAQIFLNEVQRAQDDGSYLSRANAALTFTEAAQEWITTRHGIKEATYRRYRRELDNYCLPRWGDRPLSTITRRELQAWVTELSMGTAPAAYRRRKGGDGTFLPGPMHKSLSARGIKQVVQVTGAVFRWALDAEVIRANPAARLSVPRPVQAEHIYLTHDQVATLAASALDVTGRPEDATIINVLAYTGIRINEAFALRVQDVNLGTKRLRISQAWTADKDGNPVIGLPKSGKRREVAVPQFLIAELSALVSGRAPTEYLFTAPRGGPVQDHNYRARVFSLARVGADLPDGLTPHKLRHTAASMAIGAGADGKLVQQMLGHADASETLNTYAHLWPDNLDSVADALESARTAALGSGAEAHVTKMSPKDAA